MMRFPIEKELAMLRKKYPIGASSVKGVPIDQLDKRLALLKY